MTIRSADIITPYNYTQITPLPLRLYASCRWRWDYLISIYDSCTKRGLSNVATSRSIPGRWIGRVDDSDHTFSGHFVKKTLELKRNQPAVQVPLSGNFAKKPSIFFKSTRSPTVLVEKNLQIKP